jgi:hypothetical protein
MTQQREHLTLLDISDREMLLIVRDLTAQSDGYVSSAEMAEHMDLIGDHPNRTVAVRLSWLARYGAVEREYVRDTTGNIRVHRNGKLMHTQRWRLTDLGLAMATGKLTKSQQKTLDNLGDGQMLMTMRWLTQRVVGSDAQVGKLMDREYRYGVQRR